MSRFFKLLLGDECGQDLIEYTLLIAFVALSTAGLFIGQGQSVNQVWSSANSVLNSATGSSSQPPSNGGGNGGDGSGGDHHGGDGGHH